MSNTITIDLSDVQKNLEEQGIQISDNVMNEIAESCVQAVTAAIYENWKAAARKRLHTTLPEYLNNLKVVDKGRFERQIVLSGSLPNMLESGASAFDMKEGFKKSSHVRYTVPVYTSNGKMIRKGGDWYLTVPFAQGTPGTVSVGNEMPQEIYDLMLRRETNRPLTKSEIPSPYDVPKSRAAIQEGNAVNPSYQHKHSIYEGLTKKTAAYENKTQNRYMSFRRVGENSDNGSWMHKGFKALNLAEEAIQKVDIETIVENEIYQFLDEIL